MNSYKWVKLLNEAWRSPDNPIETYIGYIKRNYYKLKLQQGCNPNFVDGKNLNDMNMRKLIEKSIEHYRDLDMSRVNDSCMK